MATSIVETSVSANPYSDQIHRLSDEQRRESTWLIIAHDEPRLVQKVQEAMVEEQAILLRVPQSHWKRDQQLLGQAIIQTLETSGVSRVALVGHSQASAVDCQSQLLEKRSTDSSPSSPDGIEESYQRLKNSVEKVQSQRDLAKKEVLEQYRRLADCLAKVDSDNQPEFHAFFYLAETGLFQKFDENSGQFRS